eukprot:SAG31_NODE_302_length_18087_cov_97.056982_4_plen_87_part_00
MTDVDNFAALLPLFFLRIRTSFFATDIDVCQQSKYDGVSSSTKLASSLASLLLMVKMRIKTESNAALGMHLDVRLTCTSVRLAHSV